jgi:hypothetical protein
MAGGLGRNKFAVILNREWPPFDGETLFFALATSKPKFFSSGFMENDIVRIPADRYAFLPLDTILNLREIPRIRLQELAASANLEIKGDLSDVDIAEVDDRLRKSILIEELILRRIR